jgi:hypothetical protein
MACAPVSQVLRLTQQLRGNQLLINYLKSITSQ